MLPLVRAAVASHPSLRRLSLIGYSLGGLIARFLAGALSVEKPSPWCGLQPVNILCVACPFLGPLRLPLLRSSGQRVQEPRLSVDGGPSLRLMRALGGRTGRQLAVADAPHFVMLALCDGVFANALRAFERRALVANAVGDRTVPFWSAFIGDTHAARPPRRRVVVVASSTNGGLNTTLVEESPQEEARNAQASAAPGYPHVEWHGLGHEADEPPSPKRDATPHDDPPGGLKLSQTAALVVLAPLGIVLLPLWILFATSSIVILGLSKRRGAAAPPPRPDLLLRSGGDGDGDGGDGEWPPADARARPQAWMAARLNGGIGAGWHKSTVRFSPRTDGLR